MAWLPDAMTTFDALPAVTSSPDVIAKQLAQVRELEEGVVERECELAGARDLCAKLCDVTSETSTRFDLKSKLSSVERPLADIRRQIGKITASISKINNTKPQKAFVHFIFIVFADARKKQLESAAKEGDSFRSDVSEALDWLSDTHARLDDDANKVTSADTNRLAAQTRRPPFFSI